MRFSTLAFQFEEAGKNIRRNGLMSLAALSIVLLAMTVLGGGLYGIYRLHQFARSQPQQLEMAVFLENATEKDRAEEVRRQIAVMPGVEYAHLYSKEQAWAEYAGEGAGADQKALQEAMGGQNPLEDRIDLKLKDARDTGWIAGALRSKGQFPDIHAVRDAHEVVDKLLGFERLVRNIGGAAAMVLFLVTAVVIQNTIRLTVFARRKEIRIMQLVGATSGFIRMPMILEGIFYGVVGTATAAGLVLLTASQISAYAGSLVSPLTQNLPQAIAPIIFLGMLTALGAAVGWMGSMLSLRRFLKRI